MIQILLISLFIIIIKLNPKFEILIFLYLGFYIIINHFILSIEELPDTFQPRVI